MKADCFRTVRRTSLILGLRLAPDDTKSVAVNRGFVTPDTRALKLKGINQEENCTEFSFSARCDVR